MSDAGDVVEVDHSTEVEVAETVTEAPKGKLTVEDALKVRKFSYYIFN